jgi:GT2 family glycosyltransferase
VSERVVTVVATRNRPALLRARSGPSIAQQIRRPDLVLVVDDSDVATRSSNRAVVEWLRSTGLSVDYHANADHAGAAHTWNRALALAASYVSDPWVAILDDDDQWQAQHLAVCLATARTCDANCVVSGITVVKDGVRLPQALPEALRRSDFYRGNPGWQGSNTFVRVDLLLAVGGFDERLPSTLDRDLAIRLLDRPELRIAFTGVHTVDYYVDSDRDALSSRGSRAKLGGWCQTSDARA